MHLLMFTLMFVWWLTITGVTMHKRGRAFLTLPLLHPLYCFDPLLS